MTQKENLDTFFNSANTRLDAFNDTVVQLSGRIKGLTPRLETSNSQFKKGVEQRDTTLEEDFNVIAKELEVFSINNEDFWTKTKESIFYFNRKDMATMYALDIKVFNNKARILTQRMDELQKSFRYLAPLIKSSGLKLSVFIFDNSLYNFERVISKILYISRDLTRLINKERC